MGGSLIRVAGLRYVAGGRVILDGLDLAIEKNDFLLIIGQNGAGKSSLLRILSGILPVSQGEVLVEGKSIAHYSRRELAKRISYLPQSDEFTLPILVKDILLAGRYPYRSLFGKLGRHDLDLLEEGVERFRLGSLLTRNMQTLSGGERKKVLLATSFIQDVPVILLDEPVNFLDPGSAVQLLQMLRELHENGRTILLVSHEIERFFSASTKILALKGGKNRYFGTKVFSPSLLQDVFQVNFERLRRGDKEIIYLNE
ncbi:MAG: ABC transporter ATP-binding protein [Candidatus Aminicenantes bacterium]|nr:ABC transporter ATP-binding protein [Candidatus Aminicenantes bacterium]